MFCTNVVFFFQAEDGIRDAQESRGLGDVYKRQVADSCVTVGVGLLILAMFLEERKAQKLSQARTVPEEDQVKE